MENLDINTTTTLNNGVKMPLLGLGTWQVHGEKAEKAVRYALEAGYRHIDTAAIYRNEDAVGRAIRESEVQRQEIFVTTKLWNDDHGYKRATEAFDRSLKKLGLSYADLYLIHWPVEKLCGETWQALEDLLESGRCRAIGVSNFTVSHLEQLMAKSPTVPAVNQVEFSPYLNQKDLLQFCRLNGIQLEAYSPLTRGKKLKEPVLLAIADKYGKSAAQILIRWALQSGIVVIPKATSREHVIQNADVFDFEISATDMEIINSFNEDFRVCWDPTKTGSI